MHKNKLKFTVLITNNPFGASANNAGYLFTRALLTQGEELAQVFFYQNGAFAANGVTDLPVGETSINKCWQNLKQEFQHKLSLIVCSSSAIRRGINENTIANGFDLGSITQLFDATDLSNKLIVFK